MGKLKERCQYDDREVKGGIKLIEIFIKRMQLRGFD
jgi:hypothetical protein